MIIVQLKGGVGNQLFQYAFGRSLALANKTDLKLDISWFDEQDLRRYELGNFMIRAEIAGAEEISELKRQHFSKMSAWKRKYLKGKTFILEEQGFEFNPAYLRAGDHTYVSGYFQSESYFSSIAPRLRQELRINKPFLTENSHLAEEMAQCESVSLHIRRGDYQENAKAHEVHGTCSTAYYDEAARLITTRGSNPVFFVFSDDINWSKKNLRLNCLTRFVDINQGLGPIEDLRLMQSCKHHIVANSTFSWWAAWLGQHKPNTVIAPKKWFNDPVLNAQTGTLIPAPWIRI